MALGGLLVLVAGLCLGPVEETDLFFRLAAGEEFLRTGHLVHRNLFSFTFPEAPYLDPAWLFDVGAALVFRAGGFPAVVLAKTAVVVALAWFAFRLCRARGTSSVVAVLVLALAFLCLRERLVERPHVFSLVGEMATLAFLPWLAEGRRRGLWLVPVVALWANLHAGAFLAPLLLGLAAAGTYFDRNGVRATAHLALAAVVGAAALLATPIGVGILRYLAFHVGIFDLHPVDEFRAVTWRSDAGSILFVVAAAGAVALARRTATTWRERLPALGLVVLGAWHVRFTADAVLFAAVVAAPAYEDLLGRVASRRPRAGAIAVLVALVAASLGPRLAEASRGGRFLAIGLAEAALPLDAIRFVEAQGLRERMYNDFETGAYLLWQGYPRYRVFVDPRLPSYPEEFHRLLGRMDLSRSEWTRAMTELGVESALLDYAGINRRVSYWDPAEWALVFRAKDSRVFVRRLPRWNQLIAALEIPASYDFTVEEGAVTRPLPAPPARSPVQVCEWQVRLGDLFFDLDQGKHERATAAYRIALDSPAGCLSPDHERAAASWVGSLDVAAGRFERALPLLDRALTVAPADPAVLTNRALALEGLHRTSEAREVWTRIATLAAGTELGQRAAVRAGSR